MEVVTIVLKNNIMAINKKKIEILYALKYIPTD